jgi:hypothetical protein
VVKPLVSPIESQTLIPPLSQEEYQNLEQSILTEGCRDSLVAWNGILIDGHNRFEICNKHRVPFATKEQNFDSKNDVCIWMIKNQFGRRNLIPYIRAGLALKLEGLFQEKALKNKQVTAEEMNIQKRQNIEETFCQNSDKTTSPNIDKRGDLGGASHIPQSKIESKSTLKPIDTKKELAKIVGISHDTIEMVKMIQASAPEEIKQKLRSGDVSINKLTLPLNEKRKNENVMKKSKRILRKYNKLNQLMS